MSEQPEKTFFIAFALSGAISAGAYTAGVLDYFFQALQAWEKARNEPETPRHRVVVQAITGASAGAITGALGAVALARGIRPQAPTDYEKKNAFVATTGPVQTIGCMLPSLYRTWVVRPRMVDSASGLDFLSAQDLADDKAPIGSLLNASLLDDIKKKALLPAADDPPPIAAPPYPYIAAKLHIYMTLSNLRGIPFEVKFGNSTYGMQTHGDRAHYVLNGLGSGPSTENAWLAHDSFRELDVQELPEARDSQNLGNYSLPELSDTTEPESKARKNLQEWDRYGTCALASSAFPVGLAPRQLSAEIGEFNKRSFPVKNGAGAIAPNFPSAFQDTYKSGEFTYLNVDGGVVNNNPFDYAQYAIMDDPEHTPTSATEATRAVIMVSPFPEAPAFLPDGAPPAEIVAVLRALYPALIDQARFKVDELIPAMNDSDYSRFLVAPERNIDGKEQLYKIACGLLGGFGGFLDEKFRAHDYQLGRRNCQAFLQSTFGLAVTNKVVSSDTGEQVSLLQKRADQGDRSDQYAIVPRLGDAAPEVPLPEWPRMGKEDFEILMKRIADRLGKVAPRFAQAQTSSRIFRALGRFGLWAGKRRILAYVHYAILSDLVRRDQIAGWNFQDAMLGMPDVSADTVRLILAEVANPAFSYRTPSGIAATTHLLSETVELILEQLCGLAADKPFSVFKGSIANQQVYTLQSRRPRGFASLRGISNVVNWLDEPVIG